MRGRLFTDADSGSAAPVVLVNREAARRFFGDDDPIGQPLPINKTTMTVVGVVGNVKYTGVASKPEAVIYRPFGQNPFRLLMLVARTSGDPAAIAADLRQVIKTYDRDINIASIQPLDDMGVRRRRSAPVPHHPAVVDRRSGVAAGDDWLVRRHRLFDGATHVGDRRCASRSAHSGPMSSGWCWAKGRSCARRHGARRGGRVRRVRRPVALRLRRHHDGPLVVSGRGDWLDPGGAAGVLPACPPGRACGSRRRVAIGVTDPLSDGTALLDGMALLDEKVSLDGILLSKIWAGSSCLPRGYLARSQQFDGRAVLDGIATLDGILLGKVRAISCCLTRLCLARSRQEVRSRQVLLSRQGLRSRQEAPMSKLAFATLAIALIACAYLALLYLAQRSLLFPAPAYRHGAAPGRAEIVRLPLGGGEAQALFLAPAALFKGPAPLLIFMHGNGELADQWLPDFEEVTTWGVAALLLEYRVTAVRQAVPRRGRSTKPRVRLTTGPNAMHGSTASASCRTAALLVAGLQSGLRSIAGPRR